MQTAAQIHSDMGISIQINQLGIGSTQNKMSLCNAF